MLGQDKAKLDISDYLSGKKELKDLLGFSQQDIVNLKGRAQFFLDGGHEERALIMLEMVEELDRKDSAATLAAARLLARRGESTSALEKLTLLKYRLGELPMILFLEAEILVNIGRVVEAAPLLRSVVVNVQTSAALLSEARSLLTHIEKFAQVAN